MSRKYKFHNKEGLYFVSFATVYWVDVFIRDEYFDLIIQSLDFCRKNKGMEIYAYCIMTSHVHLIFRAKEANPGDILRDFKSFTSKEVQKIISENVQESREDWVGILAAPIGGSITKEAVGVAQQVVGEVVEAALTVLTEVPKEYIKEAVVNDDEN